MTACGDGGMSPHTFKASVMEACPLIYLLMSAHVRLSTDVCLCPMCVVVCVDF